MANDTHTVESLLALIQGEGVRRAVAALRRPPLSSRLLQELSERAEVPEARQFVAAYPLSPSHLLEQLAQSESEADVLAFLATNPRTPPHLLSGFAGHADARVRAQAALHPQIPPRELTALTADPAWEVRCAVAANPSLRLPQFALLAADTEPSVRLRLVEHGALPPQVALVLGADASCVVRLHCVARARVDETILVGWAASDEEDIQLALTRRDDLPTTVRCLLAQSPHASVRRAVRDSVTLDDVDLLQLVTRGELDERVWVAGREMLALPLQNLLAQDAVAEVREALARNLSLAEDIARYFIGRAEAPVCAALAVNPVVPLELVQELAATRDPEVLAALAHREWLEPELMQFLLGHSVEFRGHWAIQRRPAGELTPEVAKVLLEDSRPSVQALGVAGHSGLRGADLWDFARSPAPAVRLAAVQHPRASDDLVSDLLADPSAEVAKAAELIQAKRARAAEAAAQTAREQARAHGRASVSATTPTESSATPAASSHKISQRPPARQAPGIFDKLKRIFWQ